MPRMDVDYEVFIPGEGWTSRRLENVDAADARDLRAQVEDLAQGEYAGCTVGPIRVEPAKPRPPAAQHWSIARD